MAGASCDTERSLRRAADLLLEVSTFSWQLTQSATGKPKAVWSGAGQRRPLYGAAAVKAANKVGGGPTAPPQPPPSAPPPSVPPAPAVDLAPGAQTQVPATPAAVQPSGRAARAARAAARGAKAVGSATWTVGGKLQQASAWTVERSMAAVAALGRKLKSLTWLERNTGIGRLVEREATRRQRKAAAVKAAAAAGGLGAGMRAVVEESVKMAGLKYRANRRKYGRVAMEAIQLTLSVTKKAKGLLLGIPVLNILLKPLSAVLGVLTNAATRGALSFVGKHLLAKRAVKRNPRAPGRIAQQMDKGGRPVALPTAIISRARDIRRGTGPGDLVPTNSATTSRSRRFAESYPATPEIDPAELLADLRQTVEETVGEPLDVEDGELAQVVEATIALLEDAADSSQI